MKRQLQVMGLLLLLLLAFVSFTSAEAIVRRYVEDFSTTQYKDASNTTAWWDTVAGEIKLHPFELTLAGSYDTPGSGYGVAISGDYAYVADLNYGLQVIDITDPTTPTLGGSYDTPGWAYGVAISGDYAYVADHYSGLQVIDITDPTTPTLGGSYDTPGYALGVAISGDYAYVADWESGLQVIDITDPTTPTWAGSYDTPGYAWGVAISGDYAYVADYSGLQVIDITDPTTPTWAGSYDTPGWALGVAISGDYAYVADLDSGLQVIDITDPTIPTLAGSYNTPGSPRGVAICGDYAYVADEYSRLQVIDITDPTTPTWAGSYDMPGGAYGVAISGDYAYVADEASGLQVIDITDPTTPTLAGSYDTPGGAYVVDISGDYAYVADEGSGLQVIDITDPTTPTLAGSYDTPGYAWSVAISGDYAYVADYTSGLQVIDITDPTTPTWAGSYDTPGKALGLAISGDYTYVADQLSGLQVIDITDPTTPTLAGSYDTPGWAWGVAICGDYAYVADEASGLQVIDITDPTTPTLAGSYDTPGYAWSVAISGDYAYVADYSGLQVIDITDPTTPILAGSYNTPDYAIGVAISGDYAYVVGGGSGLQVIDITDPTTPALAGSYDTPGSPWGVAISGDYAYVADGGSGLQVIQVFQRRFDPAANVAQSLIIDQSDEIILGARLKTTQNDSIRWQVSADSAANWQDMAPSDTFAILSFPGSHLLWRSTHVFLLSQPTVNPTCTDLEIEWLFNFAIIDSIMDVPNDQGGWVRICFTRSGRDFAAEGTYPITCYYLFRRIDDIPLKMRILEEGESIDKERTITLASGKEEFAIPALVSGSPVSYLDGRYFLTSGGSVGGGLPSGTWEVVGSVPAHQEDQYICLVPTLADSSSTLVYSVYCISAETTTPSVYYFSPPDSGYSVDNLVPSTPNGLMATSGDTSIDLVWNAIPEEDFRYYAVYRGTESGFTPDSSNLLGATIDTAYSDSEVLSDSTYYYRVSAFDFAGNESQYSDEVSCQFEGVLSNKGMELPKSCSLSQNYPNPFNPVTQINYALPKDSYVRLELYNIFGEKVAALVDGNRKAGYKIVRWDASSFSSGIYFYRLQAGDFVQTRKMVLIR